MKVLQLNVKRGREQKIPVPVPEDASATSQPTSMIIKPGSEHLSPWLVLVLHLLVWMKVQEALETR